MPYFKVDDGLHSHPKAAIAGDEAMGFWARAGSWCTAYGTDGFVPDWWVKQQPKGTTKARRLATAELWHRGEYMGNRPEYRGQSGYNFHQWRQDSHEKVEADREKARQRKVRSRQSQPMSQRDSGRDSGRDSARTPGYVPITHYPEENSHPESASPDSTGREPRSAPVRPDANRLVAEIIPNSHPAAVLTELRIQASALLKQGQPPDLVAAALRLWTTKNVHPKTLPSLVSELINQANKPASTSANGKPHKLRALANLASEVREMETSNPKGIEA